MLRVSSPRNLSNLEAPKPYFQHLSCGAYPKNAFHYNQNNRIPRTGFWIPAQSIRDSQNGWIPFSSAEFRIPIVIYSRIPDSKAQDSGFQKREIRGFWNPDSLIWGEIVVIINNTMTNKTIQLRNNICFLTDDNVVQSKRIEKILLTVLNKLNIYSYYN